MSKVSGARANSSDRIRAFFALPIQGVQRALLCAEIARLTECPWGRSVRWVREEGLHVTLRFLGDVETDAASALATAVGRAVATQPPFEIRFSELAWFPSSHRPRVIAATLIDEPSLDDLARCVESAVVMEGFEAESRPFRGHVTLGRLRDRARGLGPLEEPLDPTPARVDHVVLYRSELGRGRARYEELARLRLLGAANP